MKDKNRKERCDICCRKMFDVETINIKVEITDFQTFEMAVCQDCFCRRDIEKKVDELVDKLEKLEFKGGDLIENES